MLVEWQSRTVINFCCNEDKKGMAQLTGISNAFNFQLTTVTTSTDGQTAGRNALELGQRRKQTTL
jgi:hypothetical protein